MNLSLFGGRRYQVFLSSTFKDLISERQQIIQSLIVINCFPIAMEHFPASYEKQWTYIEPLIKHSDFFILLIGGKYGSCGEDGISYTQREFDCAVKYNIPILVFYHDDPNSLLAENIESTDEGKRKFNDFLQRVKTDRLCKGWNNAAQLPSLVMPSLIALAHECKRPGWRHCGDKSTEFLELQLANSNLQKQISQLEILNRNAPLSTFSDYDDAAKHIKEALSISAESCERLEETLKIRLMGVCLHKSFPTLKQFIETIHRDIRIEIRLAILNKESEVFSRLNHRWHACYEMFEEDLSELLAFLENTNIARNISIKCVKYSHMPNWHGVLINYDHLFLGHCLWSQNGIFTVGQNPYDHYSQGISATHDRKIKQYLKWFDFCRDEDKSNKKDQLLIDTMLKQQDNLDF